VHALNEYSGAVILVSHDRHMLELTADRLVMVDSGKAEEFAGTLKDYTDFVLGKNQPGSSSGKASGGNRKEERRAAAERRKQQGELRKSITAADKQMKILGTEISAIDRAMFDPATAEPKHAGLTMTDLMKLRAETQDKLDKAETLWMEATDKLEQENVDA